MKKISLLLVTALLLALAAFTFTSCEELADTVKDTAAEVGETAGYDYAIVKLFDGTTVQFDLKLIEVRQTMYETFSSGFTDYVYYLYAQDGTGYAVSPKNCVLVNDPGRDLNVAKLLYTGSKVEHGDAYIRMPTDEVLFFEKSEYKLVSMDSLTDANNYVYHVDSENIIVKLTHTK